MEKKDSQKKKELKEIRFGGTLQEYKFLSNFYPSTF